MTGENFKKNLSALRRELLATARQYFPDNEKAEDMVQDTLLRLWEMKENLREPINGIANVILRNLAIDNLRRQKPTVNIEQVDIGSPPDNDNHERYLRVMNIIDTLPDMQQTLIRLRLVEGMDYKDISKLTGIKEALKRIIISSFLCIVTYSILSATDLPYLAKVGISACVGFLGLDKAINLVKEIISLRRSR